ncbi:MAG: DUF4861 domain-containing protein [Duncaniella sp.]|nr:DUF4861 domain-containing protein [Duncaniella sp.]
MMTQFSSIITSIAIIAASLNASAATRTLSIHNPSGVDRNNCVVEADATQVLSAFPKGFIVTDMNGYEVPYQLTHDGLLLVEASVKSGETVKFTIKDGVPQSYDTICVSQIRHDFQDDYTWENDRSGYRLYGPAYRNSGGNVSGYDIWTKSVGFPVLAQRYHDHCRRGITYHSDHGNGMDAYTVGPTLGAGMNALVNEGIIIYPCAYEKCDIIENGPLRTTAEITCYPLTIGDRQVLETRKITLDKGSWLNKTTVKYDGITSPIQMANGIVVHKQNRNGCMYGPDKEYIAYADLTDNPDNGNGVIYIGVINSQKPDSIACVPFEPSIGDAVGQMVNYIQYYPGDEYTYYWGSGWSKGGIKGTEDWERYLKNFHTSLATPLQATIK